jgi:4-amino-4-deoxy-L-arabinose transferase-like glycosyltransferase
VGIAVSDAALNAPGGVAVRRISRVGAAGLLVAGIICLTVALDVFWLARFRRGYVTEWDESGYLQFSLSNFDALHDQGVWTFIKTVAGRGTFGPLVPLVTSLAYPAVTRGVFGSLLVLPLFFAGLVTATFGLARRVVSDSWAALAALCVAAIPAMTDYTRLYHFAIPATACMTAALWALLRSDGFRRPAWAAAFGLFVACTLLSRTMTVAYVPGLAAAAGVQFLQAGPPGGRVRIRNLALAAATCLLVAGPWYLRNRNSIYDYLVGRGYGEGATRFGRRHPISSWAYWTKELRIDLSYLQLSLAAAFLIAFVCALAFLVMRSPRWRVPRSARSVALLTLVVVVLEGYLALTSSRDEGTAFSLPWLPTLVVLAVVAAASVPVRVARAGLAALLVAASVVAIGSKSGLVPQLAAKRTTSVPGLGRVVVTDGEGIIQQVVRESGYDIGPVTERMPALHRRWLPVTRKVVGALYAEAKARRRPLDVTLGLDDGLFTWSRLTLAAQLWFHRYLSVDYLQAANGGDTVGSYRRQILSPNRENVLITGKEMPVATITESKVIKAARSLGFVRVRRFALPDGRRIWIWWRHG